MTVLLYNESRNILLQIIAIVGDNKDRRLQGADLLKNERMNRATDLITVLPRSLILRFLLIVQSAFVRESQ